MKCERSAWRVPGSGSLQRATLRRCGCDRNASSAKKVAPSRTLPVRYVSSTALPQTLNLMIEKRE
jgi:hypothetical protein